VARVGTAGGGGGYLNEFLSCPVLNSAAPEVQTTRGCWSVLGP